LSNGDAKAALDPVRSPEEGDRAPQPGIALCLSGGGYRAMLFHLGVLWRLAELGYLARLARISSVSGGSITAGHLALRWTQLASGRFEGFRTEVVEPIRALARRTLDVRSVLGGLFLPGTVSDKVAAAYERYLYGQATLQDFPDSPRFVLNATNVQTGALWRFSKPYMRDYLVGEVKHPKVKVAQAVGASSAFPPFLSPAFLELDPSSFTPGSFGACGVPPYTERAVLTDGGVYDNLGLETAWKRYDTILVSDAGQKMDPQPKPHEDWAMHSKRVLDLVDNQVRSLRKRQIVQSFIAGERKGTYFGIGADIEQYPAPGRLPCPAPRTAELAGVDTRLAALDEPMQERLINWGYALADAALRHWLDKSLPAPSGFPYPKAAV
jgi:NTE family protein